MKTYICLISIILISNITYSQPCKKVLPGMAMKEVIQLAGNPSRIDTLGFENNADGTTDTLMIWQYFILKDSSDQRIVFRGNKVDGEVIADGKKYDQLLLAFTRGDFPKSEIYERIKVLNRVACN